MGIAVCSSLDVAIVASEHGHVRELGDCIVYHYCQVGSFAFGNQAVRSQSPV